MGHNFLTTRETQYKSIVFNFDLREWLLQRLSFVIRQRVVVVRLGLFSPDERKIKIEMKKQGNPTAHEMDKTMLLTHRFFEREKVDEVGVPPLFSLSPPPTNYALSFCANFLRGGF
jgi:hypothetical protein